MSAPVSRLRRGSRNPKKEVLCYYGDGSFGMTAFDMETANRFGVPYIAVIGNNSAMNQIRYGQLAKYGEQRGNVGNLLGDGLRSAKFAEMLGGYGGGGPAIPGTDRAGPAVAPVESIANACASLGRRATIWVGPTRIAPGTKTRRCTSDKQGDALMVKH